MNTIYFIVGDPAVTLTTLSVASAFGLVVGAMAAFVALRDEGDVGVVAGAAYVLAATVVLLALLYVPLRADMQRTEVRQAIADALDDYDGTVEYNGDTAVLTDPSGATCQYNVELPGDDTDVGRLSPRDCDDTFTGPDN